jgi:hypothetical protein
MATGEKQHEDFTAQATPAERRRVYKDLKEFEDAKEKAYKGVTNYEQLRNIRVECTDKKCDYKLNIFKHWQAKKHAQINSSAVQRQDEERCLVHTRMRRMRMRATSCLASRRLTRSRTRMRSESASGLRSLLLSRWRRRASRARRKRLGVGKVASRPWRWQVWGG